MSGQTVIRCIIQERGSERETRNGVLGGGRDMRVRRAVLFQASMLQMYATPNVPLPSPPPPLTSLLRSLYKAKALPACLLSQPEAELKGKGTPPTHLQEKQVLPVCEVEEAGRDAWEGGEEMEEPSNAARPCLEPEALLRK